MKTVNKLDYIYRQLVIKAKEQHNDTIEISDEEYDKYYEVESKPIELTPDSDLGEEDPNHDYSQDYFTIELLEDGYIECSYIRGSGDYFEYSIDNGNTWNLLNLKRVSFELIYSTIDLLSGTKILIKGNRYPSKYGDTGMMGIAQFNSIPFCKIYGNIMSLSYKEDFININNDLYSHMFCNLFYGCKKIIDTKNLIFPNKLNNFCYSGMFAKCTSLIIPPKLPATTLANGCYSNMFYGCSSLITAPELPAMYLSDFPYSNMFCGCSSLITAPELPATIMTTECYYGMFNGCTSLNYIKCLAIDISAKSCTQNWVHNVASSGTFIKNAVMNDWPIGTDSGIPVGWTVQEIDPETGEIVNEYVNE